MDNLRMAQVVSLTRKGEDEVQRLREALEVVHAVMRESEGVAGYHLNGAVASWDELEFFELIESALGEK